MEFKKCLVDEYNFNAIKEEVIEQVKSYAKKNCHPQNNFYQNNYYQNNTVPYSLDCS